MDFLAEDRWLASQVKGILSASLGNIQSALSLHSLTEPISSGSAIEKELLSIILAARLDLRAASDTYCRELVGLPAAREGYYPLWMLRRALRVSRTEQKALAIFSRHIMSAQRESIARMTTPKYLRDNGLPKGSVGYIRRLTGSSSCGYCVGAAANGVSFELSSTSDYGFHDHCDCFLSPATPRNFRRSQRYVEELQGFVRRHGGEEALSAKIKDNKVSTTYFAALGDG